MNDLDQLRKQILNDVREYARVRHAANRPGDDTARAPFEAGKDPIPYAGRVFTEYEVEAAVSATLDFWLTLGPEGSAFEKELAETLGVKHSLLVNSGSSANLLAVSALTSHKLPEERRLRPGDEVITCAAGFPTTVAPILQNGAVPVFIDNDPVTGNARVGQLEEAYSEGKTKAVILAHTLGNPFDLSAVLAFCRRHDLWLIEDNCDALGSTYSLPAESAGELGLDHLLKAAENGEHPLIRFEPATLDSGATTLLTAPTGTFGDLSTQSFYPPHHLTMGEGGAVNIVRRPQFKTLVESFRDWGRDCWCPSGKDNTCGKRFGWQLGELPEGYDHKYIYSHLGYNLKPLDPQAAIGRVQLRRLSEYSQARRRNWQMLREGLAGAEEFFEFSLPTHSYGWNPEGCSWERGGLRSDPSWFGFMLRVRESAPFSASEFAAYLDEHKIGNRMLFGGNLLRQPAFVQLRQDRPESFRVRNFAAGENPPIGECLPGADQIMNEAVFLGTFPGLSGNQLEFMVSTIQGFSLGRHS